MKIVHCVFSFGIGGAETMLIDILNEQSKTETVSLVIVNHVYLDFLLEQINPAVRIFKLRRQKGSYSPFPVLKLNWLLYRLNPDVIHVHSSALLRIIALRAGRGLFLTGGCVKTLTQPFFMRKAQ
ncbi:glycosyltransferase, partial [Bacteroides stercoris]|uniref:glycosyltransferase n=1 Tax=Bacteroides stercoris TaxID=46506 RepID=UPI002FDAE4E2